MDILSKLFGSAARLKALKLFIFNPDAIFNSTELALRTNIYLEDAQKEISTFHKIGLIKKKSGYMDEVVKSGAKKETKRKKINGYSLDANFPYLEHLSNLIKADKDTHKMVVRKLHGAGKLKLVIASGFLTEDPDSRIDLLVVGDSLKRGPLENAIKSIESEIGRELRYACFETPEFQYRMSIYDRLIRDIIEFPHLKLLNRIGME